LSGALSDRSCHPRGCQVVPSDRIRHPRTLGVVRGPCPTEVVLCFYLQMPLWEVVKGSVGSCPGSCPTEVVIGQLPWDPLSLQPSRGVAPIGRPRAVRRLARASRKAVPGLRLEGGDLWVCGARVDHPHLYLGWHRQGSKYLPIPQTPPRGLRIQKRG